MKYILVLILCILATLKMSLQGMFGKNKVKNSADAFCFNALIFLFSSIAFLYEIVGCPWQVWIYATFSAVFSVIFQMTYTKALAIGNVSLTALIVNLSLVINVLVSYIFFDDNISVLRLVGILTTIVTLFMSIDIKSGISIKGRNWILFVITAMLTSSAGSIVQKVLGESQFATYNRAFTSASYLVAAVLAFLMYKVQKSNGEDKTFKIGKDAIIYAMSIGVVLAIYVVINVYALSTVEGTFFFPTYAGGTIILSTLSGVLFFKDKLSGKQIIGVILGIVAVVLMNF